MSRRGIGVVLLFILAIACGGSSPTMPSGPGTTTPPQPLHGEVTDPRGDAVQRPGVENPPDLVHGTADVRDGDVTFRVRLTPGTYDPPRTRFGIDLNIDQDHPAPGVMTAVDYQIFVLPFGDRGAAIARITNTSLTIVGTVPVDFVGDGVM